MFRANASVVILCLAFTAVALGQQKLSVRWEELTEPDFVAAIQRSQGVCLLPFGILEKHGPQLPLGTDLIDVRYVSLHAAEQEYAVVFPEYYFGQIFEARQWPGTIAYSPELQLKLLQETTDEMARNGCRKIIIVNGHGGNNSLLPYFAQTQMQQPHDYVVYVETSLGPPRDSLPVKTQLDMHAGEVETSKVLVSRPDLVQMDKAATQSGADMHRLNLPEDLYTGIWWYARFPNHYAGQGAAANKALGEKDMQWLINNLVTAIKAVKQDDQSLPLQNQFYEESKHPLQTKPK